VESVEHPQVFFTYEWALAVQRAYSSTLLPLIFLAYDRHDAAEDEHLSGVAALASDAGGAYVSFLCATTGDYCDFLSSRASKPAFVGAVLAELRKMAVKNVTLTNLPADSTTVSALRKNARYSGYHLFARTAYVCAQVSLANLERRPGENKLVLPRKKMLRRFLNAMGREAPVRLDHARTWKTVSPILPQFRQSHIARFLITGRISNLARPERILFLEELAKLLGERGWLALTRMMSGSKSFAWNYGFQFRETWFWYQPTFDSDLEKYSPGFCLLAKVIEEAADDQTLTVVDLGLGAEEYKERFANQSRKTLYITLKSSAFQHVREILRYRASEVARASPKVESILRALAARLEKLEHLAAREGALAAVRWLARKARQTIFSRTEVFFYEWDGSAANTAPDLHLEPLDLDRLATATLHYVDDDQTLSYLLRAAGRLREGKAVGFGLLDGYGKIVHFTWATPFEGFFLSELNAPVKAPAADCVMLFDSWTPISQRSHGYYGIAMEQMARRIQEQGKKPWIFSAANNLASVYGLQRTGFQRRYSVVRRKLLGWQTINGDAPRPRTVQPAELLS